MGPRIYMHEEKTYTPATVFDSDVTDGLRSSILLDMARKHRLVVACCEPGYCSASTLRSVGIQAERLGYRFVFRDFAASSPSAANDSLLRVARDAYTRSVEGDEPAVVAINLLPPCDEIESARLSKAIERLLKANCLVVATLLPEARQITEEFPSFLLLTSEDLCEVSALAREGSGFAKGGDGFTRGIPVLAHALASYKGDFDQASMPASYWDALGRVVESGFRPSLCEEELRLRFAIVLLGDGTFAELERVLGSDERDFLYDMSVWAPFYGVSVDSSSFACLSARSHEWANGSLPAFVELAAEQQLLLAECLSLLGERGDWDCFAAFLRFASEEAAADMALSWAAELADAGYVRLLSASVDSAKRSGRNDATLELAEYLVNALGMERIGSRVDFQALAGYFPGADEGTSLMLALIDLRSQLRVLDGRELLLCGIRPGLVTRLQVHREAMSAMFAGHFGKALEILAPMASTQNMVTVTDCILRIDLSAAQMFACGASWDDKSTLATCKEFLTSKGYFGLMGYVWGLELVIEALCSSPAGTAALIRSKAVRSGDLLIKSLALVSESFGLLRRKPSAYILASVSAARNCCKELSWGYATRVCDVMGQVAHYQLGESAGLYVVGESGGIGAVSEVIGELTHDMRTGAVPVTLKVRPVPVDELWLVIAICDGMGDISRSLEDQVPVEWRRALDVARKNSLNARKLASWSDGGNREPASRPSKSRGVRITLLGGFGLVADGRKVSDWLLGVRDAKPLLEFLALQPGRMASRERVAQLLWPEVSESAKARQKVYSATAAARKALLKHGYRGDVFSSNKATKSIGLSNDLVSCDVDEFVSHARAAIDGNGDLRICESALKAEGLYAGDLCILSDDQSGYLASRREELKRLYADAMLGGGEAALRLDKKRLAARFANDVLYIDPCREDAVVLLVRALRRSGRGDEAQRCYRRFVKRVEAVSGRAPSLALQAALAEPLGTIGKPLEQAKVLAGA